ncbi:hypothetical protein BKG69_07570 [Mycobacteroides chelonae]|nr:hypothetical protein BKG69_07570 [Mycobacteroides chelonae]
MKETQTVRSGPPSTASVGQPPSSEAPDNRTWTMPDLVGQNLQAAQDAIQALTGDAVFFTGSTDATGRGRQQVLDRNWKVCASTPAPGSTFGVTTKIDFSVVKFDTESCP